MSRMSELDIQLKEAEERAEMLRKGQTVAQEYLVSLLKTKGYTRDYLDYEQLDLGTEMLLKDLYSDICDVIDKIEDGEIK